VKLQVAAYGEHDKVKDFRQGRGNRWLAMQLLAF
jgi:hypothetical protein